MHQSLKLSFGLVATENKETIKTGPESVENNLKTSFVFPHKRLDVR